MTQPLFTFAYPTVAVIRDNILRTIQNGLVALGVSNPDVSQTSDYYILASALANELAPAYANGVIASDATMPDTATGTDLDRWLAAVGLARRPASGSSGVVTFSSSIVGAPGVFIATGTILLDTAQKRYQVTVGGNYYDGQLIPVSSVDIGAQTNHANGETFTWNAGPPFSAKTVTVGTSGGTDGLSGGADAENDDQARARLLARLANAPSAGNWQHTAELAEASTPKVEKAFVYPALLGPATTAFAVTARATAANRSRQLDSTTLNTVVVPYLQGLMPEFVYSLGYVCTNVATNVALLLNIPNAPTATPPGAGGGWLDGTPWPSSISGTTPVTVTSVTSTTRFVVNATTAPIAGATHISFLNPSTWTIYSATVTVVNVNTPGAYDISIDQPFVGIATGNYIFPTSQNQALYIAALLNGFAQLGPGEATANAGAIQRAFRHPLPSIAWPYSLGPAQTRLVEQSSSEVLSATWLYRSTTTPAVGAPPNILVPNNIGLYAA